MRVQPAERREGRRVQRAEAADGSIANVSKGVIKMRANSPALIRSIR
jgi:hypothetical protein